MKALVIALVLQYSSLDVVEMLERQAKIDERRSIIQAKEAAEIAKYNCSLALKRQQEALRLLYAATADLLKQLSEDSVNVKTTNDVHQATKSVAKRIKDVKYYCDAK